jgi:hypothetical protein
MDRSRRRCRRRSALHDLANDRRRNLEQVRILVGIAQNAGNGYPIAADLLRNVAGKILRCDHLDLAIGGARGRILVEFLQMLRDLTRPIASNQIGMNALPE